ncbi:glutathione transferase GstA [Paracoccaceae bacterium Fryx2]|nr:glutathione transferase GstA [Paracoccaceae bacterium Fryx2]
MKLYYAPGACSLASHIILHEVGRPFTIERVNGKTKETETGADFRAINPKGAVPALETDGGEVLTEGAAILQFIADNGDVAALSPPPGSMARARLQEMLNYISSELHKSFSPLFRPGLTDEGRAAALDTIAAKLGWLERTLSDGRPYLTGDAFGVADAYGFVVTGWSGMLKVDLSPFPHILAWRARLADRASVQAAMRAEGLAA